MRRICQSIALFGLFVAGSAFAEDKTPCRVGAICANNPNSVVEALRAEGYKAKLGSDGQGDPMIESAASGYDFETYFYGCKAGKNCESLQFRVAFTKEPENTAELANKWNAKRRFSSMYVLDDGTLIVSWDVSTFGGLSKVTFHDVLASWVAVMDGLGDFFDANIPDKPDAKKGS